MTDGTTRREFLNSLAAFSLFPLEQEKPELILHNGHLVTMNPADPFAEAVAIARGRFFAVGKNADVLNLAVPGVRKIDLGGKTVLPGFNDAHSHPAGAGLSHLRMVDCDLRSISAIQAAMRERAAKTPAGEWVLGFKYDDTKTEDGRPSASTIWIRRFRIIPCTLNIAATRSTPIPLRFEKRESMRRRRILLAGKLIT